LKTVTEASIENAMVVDVQVTKRDINNNLSKSAVYARNPKVNRI
tara:strand:- start:747 stop:878 length:132 start_codon:yes stop_codon:yes gene_type:complete